MKNVAILFLYPVALLLWLAGIVLSKGFISTCAAICLPFYAWYLVVERVLMSIGWVTP